MNTKGQISCAYNRTGSTDSDAPIINAQDSVYGRLSYVYILIKKICKETYDDKKRQISDIAVGFQSSWDKAETADRKTQGPI